MDVRKVLTYIFEALTICGAAYVLYTGNVKNAGYAVVPMLFCLIFSQKPRTKVTKSKPSKGAKKTKK